MSRAAASLAALIGVLLVPLALAAPTSFVLIPAHLSLTLLTLVAIGADTFHGRPGRVLAWPVLYVGASVAMVVALEAGFSVRTAGWYTLTPVFPWVVTLTWVWTVPLAGLVGYELARMRRRRLSRIAVARRKKPRKTG